MTDENKTQILIDGLNAFRSISESIHAVSTSKRFKEFSERHKLLHEDRSDCSGVNEYQIRYIEGKKVTFELIEERKQRGYGAWHIGSEIDQVREKGRIPLIIEGRRNKRYLFASKLEKEVNENE